MKKVVKTIAGIALAGCMAAGAVSFSACAKTRNFYGDYHYSNAYSPDSPDYGIKVKVSVQTDGKGDRIKSVEIIDSVYTEVSASNPSLNWDNTVWYSGVDALLRSYRGKYLADVLCAGVRTSSTTGEPSEVLQSELKISGATQGSGRLLKAVQSALLDAAQKLGYTVCEGVYRYTNEYGAKYGANVRVVLKGETVQKVGLILTDEYAEASPAGTDPSKGQWAGRTQWDNGLQSLLDAYTGKTVEHLLQQTVETNVYGQPSSVSDDSLKLEGATQGSGRVLLAVQAALKKAGFGYEVLDGDYHYEKYGHVYGIKVKVTVRTDKISKVEVAESDYVSASPAGSDPAQGQWAGRHLWDDGLAGLLASYEGKNVTDVLAATVGLKADGEPESVSDDSLKIEGATQGSGRLLLAVQNALSKLEGYSVVDGDYHYNKYGHDYGIKVRVVVNGGEIAKAAVIPSDYVSASPAGTDPSVGQWSGRHLWDEGLDGLLKSYEGKSVDDVFKASVSIADDGEPKTVTDDSLKIEGATQGSGRLLLAVQDALSQLEGYSVLVGEYKYNNQYNAAYGAKVKVVLKGDSICNVTLLPSVGYVSASPAGTDPSVGQWSGRHLWDDGVAGLLASYSGRNVAEVLSQTVETDSYGQPSSVSDDGYKIEGATQGSGRLLLAVQDALKSAEGYSVVDGDYHYNKYGHDYGIKVRVVVKGGAIAKVAVIPSDYVSASPAGSDPAQGQWVGRHLWDDGLAGLLASYEGKNVTDVLAATVGLKADGEPESVSDDSLKIEGATQGSGRLLKAVQDALSKLN